MIIERIDSPADLKRLSAGEMDKLADEMRALIVSTVMRQGGHLASNLGTVELIIALHYVFDAPTDKLVFDVGHQAYAHKILTGRRDVFARLREAGGVSGFPRIDESPYDAFTGGHASNAISAAAGMARARDMSGEGHCVTAILGDGAMTGGLCYEALNDIGGMPGQFLVVLNDNEMSISKNVGALSTHLTGLRQSGLYQGTKRLFKRGLLRIPGIGRPIVRGIDCIKRTIRRTLLGDQFFDALGFEYLGPIDGHDIRRLIRALKRAKERNTPVFLHVVTRKGRGFREAEDQPVKFHGVAPHYMDKPDTDTKKPRSNGDVAVEALIQMAESDRRVAVLTAAMPVGTCADRFAEKFPRRFVDVGIAEGHMVTSAAGMAAGGMKPYVMVYSSFLQRGYDQLIHDVCIAHLPVTLLIDRSGLVGPDGATHQGVFDLSYLRQMPGMIVASPRDAHDLKRLIALSRVAGGPMAIRYARDTDVVGEFGSDEKFEIGQWEMLISGEDVMILAVGHMVAAALRAAIELSAHGVRCGVIDARFVKPIDEDMLKRALGAHLIVTLEDNLVSGGFGSAVLEALAQWRQAHAVMTLGVPDRYIEYGTIEEQHALCGLTPPQIARSILERLGEAEA